MEYLDQTNTKSFCGATLTAVLGFLSHVTKEDVLVWVSIIAGLVTIGYTVDKWIRSYKRKES